MSWLILFAALILITMSSGVQEDWRAAIDVFVMILLIVLLRTFCLSVIALCHPIVARLGFRPSRASRTYVKHLFDGYAERFDRSLFIELDYTGPNLLRRTVGDHLDFASGPLMIGDLGCGTGACGPLFRRLASQLIGVDVSPKMLDKARKREVYDALYEDDLTDFLRSRRSSFDLLIAADVFVYIGDLRPVMHSARRALRSGGWFAFTVEHVAGGDYHLDRSGRYQHAPGYIEALAFKIGFTIESRTSGALRLERNRPVNADVWLLRSHQNQ